MNAMQSINALTLAPDVNNWLADSDHPRILHVFDHTCNLINERREVLSIVTPQIGNGPFNLVVEGEILFSEHLNIQTLVLIHDHQLILGDLMLNTRNAKLWSPHPNWKILHAKRQEILNQLTQLQLTNYLVRGLDTLLGEHSKILDHRGLSITKYQFSNSLLSALANADLHAAITATKQLAGLGQGLTPAGDDFILGALYAAWIIHPTDVAKMLAEEIANTAAPLTTSLSAAWLRSGGKGEVGILWHEFFDALISSDPMRIQEHMEKILDVGESSGSDALAGFIGLFRNWLEYRSNLWEYNQT